MPKPCSSYGQTGKNVFEGYGVDVDRQIIASSSRQDCFMTSGSFVDWFGKLLEGITWYNKCITSFRLLLDFFLHLLAALRSNWILQLNYSESAGGAEEHCQFRCSIRSESFPHFDSLVSDYMRYYVSA